MNKYIVAIIFAFSITGAFSQKQLYYPEFRFDKLKEGTYKIKSHSKEFQNEKLPVILSELDTLMPEKYPYFLNPNNEELVLFENHDLNNLKPVARLNSLAQVNVDSIIYKYKFKDLTNCVWNRLIINDKFYYTDADIHDFGFSKVLTKLNQKMEVVGQFDGYDGTYHIGYPEFLFIIFTDNNNKIISRTNVLDFQLNDEFAMEEDILELEWNQKIKSYEITLIGADDKIRVSWDGKKSEIKKL